MKPVEAQQIIDTLAKGRDPETGELLPLNSCLNSPEIIRALFLASKALDAAVRKTDTNSGRPINTGKPWSKAEDEQLLKEFDAGIIVSDIASNHKRTAGGIISRLVRLGQTTEMSAPLSRGS